MPQFKLAGFGQEEVQAEGGNFAPYDGPLPPTGTRLRVKIKQFKMKINKNNDYMLNCVAEVDLPKGHPNAKYNGLGIWWNGNITKQGAGYINEFLMSIAGSATTGKKLAEALWAGKHGGIRLVGAKEPVKTGTKIAAIGPKRFGEDLDTYAEVVVRKAKNKQSGDWEAQVGSWVLPKKVDETPDDEVADEEDEDYSDDVDEEDGVEVEEEEEEDGDEESSGGPRDDVEDEDSDDEDEKREGYSKEPPF